MKLCELFPCCSPRKTRATATTKAKDGAGRNSQFRDGSGQKSAPPDDKGASKTTETKTTASEILNAESDLSRQMTAESAQRLLRKSTAHEGMPNPFYVFDTVIISTVGQAETGDITGRLGVPGKSGRIGGVGGDGEGPKVEIGPEMDDKIGNVSGRTGGPGGAGTDVGGKGGKGKAPVISALRRNPVVRSQEK
ncbi:hypothetical protein FB451DRAFT_1374657 [Mycena latifolia]|nr:hypothetical protein FB451DRAFT_1374657 [Mycena latifolia]